MGTTMTHEGGEANDDIANAIAGEWNGSDLLNLCLLHRRLGDP